MKLIKAKHKVYGVVTVPDTYLVKWPAAYKPLDATPEYSPPDREEPRTTAHDTTTKE